MSDPFKQRCAALISELGIAPAESVQSVRSLTGGVASDIGVVSLPDRDLCVKFALPKLRVASNWEAPVHRNRAEYAWLSFAKSVTPLNAPALLGWSASQNGFAMEYLTGTDVYLWKEALLEGTALRGETDLVAKALATIHAASSQSAFDRSAFDNRDDFKALRLEPYLIFTASQYPDLAPQLEQLSATLYAADAVLVHGDVSPKNILFRDGAPILLDAECATMGDASFDVSFCLNHLILKALHIPQNRTELLASARAFWTCYSADVTWEAIVDLEARIAALVPALMLARIDGKSPVEYLNDAERDVVRKLAVPLIDKPVKTLADLLEALSRMDQI